MEDNLLIKNDNIDQLTLETFMNKKNYKKYIEKANPQKYTEIQNHHLDLMKYRGSIITMTDDLLENPNLQITTEINDIFDAYTKTIIRHFKNKEFERKNPYYEDETQDEEEDILFGKIDDIPKESLWGKERVIKKQASCYNKKDISRFSIPRISSL
jgi:hypothetical protein